MTGAVGAAAQGLVRLPVWRARFVLAALIGAFVVLALRALYLQALRTDFLQERGDARYSRVLEVPATRGRILDRNGEALAVSTPVKSISASWASRPRSSTANSPKRRAISSTSSASYPPIRPMPSRSLGCAASTGAASTGATIPLEK